MDLPRLDCISAESLLVTVGEYPRGLEQLGLRSDRAR